MQQVWYACNKNYYKVPYKTLRWRQYIVPFVALAIVGLVAGLWAGMIRLGWHWPGSALAGHHGGLMIGGFLGTLIALERAVTLPRWALLVPLMNGISVPLWLMGAPILAQYALMAGGLGLAILCYWPIRTSGALWHYFIWVGALFYLSGILHLWYTQLYPVAFPWFMAFFLFTIVGERLELSRFLPILPWQKVLLILGLLLFFLSILLPYHASGRWVMALSLGGTGFWLLRFDMARKSLHKKGLHRFVAGNLLLGFLWLIITAGLAVYGTLATLYDAVLHSFFIGFVMAMIFAHAPIIFPGVLRLSAKPYHPILWVWTALLHGSLVLRMVGDLMSSLALRQWSGLVSGIVILGYLLSLASLIAFRQWGNRRMKPGK